MKITVEQALIKTATAEIRTLTIEDRQMTLAVFRQLEEAPVVDYQLLRLNGLVWGKVNYHPDLQCKTCGNHIHLVWQSGTELRRSLVAAGDKRKIVLDYSHAVHQASKAILATIALNGHHFKKAHLDYSVTFRTQEGEHTVSFSDGDPLKALLQVNYSLTVERQPIDASSPWAEDEIKRRKQADTRNQIEKQQAMAQVREKYPLSMEQAHEEYSKRVVEMTAYERDWKTLYEKLAEAQQLFIAV